MVNVKKESLWVAGLVEIVIISVLVIVVSGILNYFNILPLSNTFSFLSFLPKQSTTATQIITTNKVNQTNSGLQVNNKFVVIPLIIATAPKEFENTDSEYKFQLIGKSALSVPANTQLIIEADLAIVEETKENIYTGLLIAKDLKDKDGKTLFLAHDSNKWNLIYRQGDEIKTVHFSKSEIPENNIKVSIFISPEGNKISAKLNNGTIRSIDLEESFYSDQREIKAFTQLGTASKLKINALKFLLPK